MPTPNYANGRASNPIVNNVVMSTKVTEFRPGATGFTPTVPFTPTAAFTPTGGFTPNPVAPNKFNLGTNAFVPSGGNSQMKAPAA